MAKRQYPNYMSQKEYKQLYNAERCPRCFSNRIEVGVVGAPEDSTTVLIQGMRCVNCNANWNEEYALSCFHANQSGWLEDDRDDIE